jgi:diaminopimelate decarboxylase
LRDARRLVEEFGSPLYVYRLEQVQAACDDLLKTLPQPSTLLYSLKANPHPVLVSALLAGGCGGEVSSIGELELLDGSTTAPRTVLYTGPGKTTVELTAAVQRGARLFSVESPLELERLNEVAARQGVLVDCLIRVNPSGPGVAGQLLGAAPVQFGVDATRMLDEPESFRRGRSARVAGLHFYTATNVRDQAKLLTIFESHISTALELRDRCDVPLRTLGLGGGFAAPYGQPGARPRYRLRQALETVLDCRLPLWRRGSPAILFESGRHLVGTAGELVCTVVDVKRSRGRTFVVLDTGIHHIGGLAGLGRTFRPALTPSPAASEPAMRADLTGSLCTPADVLSRNVELAPTSPGDTLVIPNVGAYGLTASLIGFLSRQAPLEVVLSGDEVLSATRISLDRRPMD